jgi:hypothetical protein
MKKLLLALLLLFAAPAFAGTPAELHALFADWRRFHAGPGGVPDYTPPAVAARAEALKGFQAKLAAIDTKGWNAADKVDWQLVQAEMNGL